MVNVIKTWSLNARLLSLLCQEMGAKYEKLLFHTDVGWLLGKSGFTSPLWIVFRGEDVSTWMTPCG